MADVLFVIKKVWSSDSTFMAPKGSQIVHVVFKERSVATDGMILEPGGYYITYVYPMDSI